MIRLRNVLAVAAIAAIATPLSAQDRGVILKVMGGGYSHTMNLNTGPDFAHFKAGIALNAGLGIQANKYLALMGDFTFSQTRGLGDVSFVNDLVYRYYYGAQLQLRYPLGKGGGLAPYIFGGGGRVHVDQKGIETVENFQHFTRNAGLFGAGFTWAVPRTHVALLAEGKGMYYKWVAAPFNRNQFDISYSVGVSYRIGF